MLPCRIFSPSILIFTLHLIAEMFTEYLTKVFSPTFIAKPNDEKIQKQWLGETLASCNQIALSRNQPND